ncbi:MAG: PAS domain S-box protein [Candidatus Thermochlorobacter sp.]
MLTTDAQPNRPSASNGNGNSYHTESTFVTKEEYLRVLQERDILLQLIDNLPDSIYAKDASGRFLISNRKNTELLGKTDASEVIGKTDFDFYDRELAEKYRQDELVLLSSNQDAVHIEEPNFNTTSGEKRWILTTKVVRRDEHGTPVGLFGIGRDITLRKQTEEALRRSEETFRKTANALPGMIYQILFHPDGKITYPFVSEGSRAIYGIAPEVIMQDSSVITKMWHPDDVDEYMRRVEECRRTLKPFNMDCRIILPDGKIKWLHVQSTPQLEPGGYLRFYGVRTDITAQKETETKLRLQPQQMNAAADLAKLAFWEGDVSSQTLIFNAQVFMLLGTSLEKEGSYEISVQDYLGRFVLAEDVPMMISNLEMVLSGKAPMRGEITYRIRRADDGSIRYLKAIYNIIRNAEGVPVQLFGPIQDITDQKQAEEALRQSEETFRKTVNTVPSVIYQLKFEPDGSYSYPFVSGRCKELYEVSAEEAMRDASVLTKMWHPDDVQEYWRQIKHTLDNLVPLDITVRIITPSGKTKWVRINSQPEKQPDGSIVLYGVLTDITAQKETEAKLRLQQQQMNAAADLAKLAFWECDLSRQTFIFNAQVFMLLGTSLEKEGSYEISVQDYLGRFVLAEDVPEMLRHLEMTLSSKDLMRGEATYRIRRADDGSIRYLKVIYNIIRNAEGVPVQLFGPIQDITDQKQAEEALRQSEENFRKTVNAVPGMIYQLASMPDGTLQMPYVSSGSRTIFGLEPEAIMNNPMTFFGTVHPDDVAKTQVAVAESAANLSPFSYEVRHILPSGNQIWTRYNAQPTPREDGSIVWYGVCVDITHLKELEAELHARLKEIQDTQKYLIQSEKMSALGQMVAGVAHELNTPIGYASNNVSIIRDRFKNISSVLRKALEAQECIYNNQLEQAFVKMQEVSNSPNGTLAELDETIRRTDRLFAGISSGFEQMSNLVKSMRNFSRLDEAEMKKADINEGLRNCLLMIGHKLKDKNIELITEYGDLPMVDCYPAQLNQVFLNLIDNAIHAAEERPNGQICVKSSLEQDYIIVRVTDNGKGIPRHVQSKIFDPFFTTKPVGKGTGLGLSICYNIVQKHKGELYFETEEGVGTTFFVKIPAVDFLDTQS